MSFCSSNLLVLAQALRPVVDQAPEPTPMSPWMMGLLVVALIFVPFGIGTMIARALKLKDLSMKIGVVALTLVLGLAPFVSQYFIGASEQSRYEELHAEWEAKQEYRDKISDKGVADLKEAIPGLEVLRPEREPEPAPKTK